MIIFQGNALDQVARAAERAYPEECCGLLIGRWQSDGNLCVSSVVESVNVACEQRTRRFEVDPALRLSLMRRLRGGRDEIVGHYHSHPQGDAIPSAYDAGMVHEPELVWLIVAVHAGRAGETACWRWDRQDGRFRRCPHRRQIMAAQGSAAAES